MPPSYISRRPHASKWRSWRMTRVIEKSHPVTLSVDDTMYVLDEDGNYISDESGDWITSP